MTMNKYFVYILSTFSFGVLMMTFILLNNYFAILLFSFFLLFILIFLFFKIKWHFLLLFLLFFLLGMFRYSLNSFDNDLSKFFIEEKWKIVAKVHLEPDKRADKIKYVLSDVRASLNGDFFNLDGFMMLNAPLYPEYFVGETISFNAKIEKPFSSFDFNYEEYLYRYGIYYFVKNPNNLYKIEEASLFDLILGKIFKFKDLMITRLVNIFGEPYASFMSGILLGLRKGFSNELSESFKNSGLTHIVAVSGYNITILIVFVYGVFSFMSQRLRVFFSLIFILIFVFLTGFSASAVRAGIMGCVSLFAVLFGKNYHVKTALFLSAFLMIFFEPRILYFDVGFQLSFLATIGLIYVSPLIEKYFLFIPNILELRNSFVLTISSTISTLPILAMNFGIISLFSPFANILVLPFIPFVMLFSFLALIISFFSSFFSLIIAFPAFVISSYIFAVIKFFGDFSFSVLNVEMVPIVFWFLYFCFVFFEIFLSKDEKMLNNIYKESLLS